jgi:hypothetical protein
MDLFVHGVETIDPGKKLSGKTIMVDGF